MLIAEGLPFVADPELRGERAWATRTARAYELSLSCHLGAVLHGAGKGCARTWKGGEYEAVLTRAEGMLYAVLAPSLYVASQAFAKHVTEGALEAKATDFGKLNAALDAFAKRQAARKIKDVSASLRKIIRSIIDQGLQNDRAPEDVEAAIEEAVTGELGSARAARIARTEAHTASEFGKFAAAQASGLRYVKEWISTEDERVRKDHAAAHGQRVALAEAFLVGGEELMYPGDPDASAGQIINCRCVAHYTRQKRGPLPKRK